MTKLKSISVRWSLRAYKETATATCMTFLNAMQIYTHAVCPIYNRESEGGRTFSVSATRLWNSLPIDLKKGTCVTSFRKAIYSHFLTRYNDVDHFSLSET